ncbi:MAG: hypothetical protein AB7K63_20340 [Vicinamibacterales bacterium]
MRHLILGVAVFCSAVTISAQVENRAAEPPQQSAASEAWYLARQPITINGQVYYPAGPAIFFNGNRMVPSGQYNGVPIYADPTVEPNSVFLVPIGRGLMQPYQRQRLGAFPAAEAPQPAARPPAEEPRPVGTAGTVVARPPARPVVSLLAPQGNDGIWIQYQGAKWVSRGPGVPLEGSGLTRAGEYAGFPVYERATEPGVIYVPTREGIVAPYRRK